MNRSLSVLTGILQQADYDPALFRSWLARHPAPEDWEAFEKKAVPRWTAKARILFWIALAKSLGIPRLMPPMLLFACFIVKPFEKIAIWTIARRAREKLQKIQFREVIGITGSFGKTTVKELLAHVLEKKIRVNKTPENTNTLLGTARWILRKSDFQNGDILIVEMGAYRRGDIRALCRMARPTMGVLTGLNEAHLERFGSLENTFRTKMELAETLPAGGVFFSEMTPPNFMPFAQKHKNRWKKIKTIHYSGKEELAFLAGARFGISKEELVPLIKSFSPPERHFSRRIAAGDRLIIDDSYNITLDGASHACREIKNMGRRKIGVFAGIPEAGEASERVNKELGRLLGETFDYILLQNTPVRDFILAGLREKGFSENSIARYTEKDEVEAILRNMTQDGSCIYFSAYDWPAIYL